eukprot:403351480
MSIQLQNSIQRNHTNFEYLEQQSNISRNQNNPKALSVVSSNLKFNQNKTYDGKQNFKNNGDDVNYDDRMSSVSKFSTLNASTLITKKALNTITNPEQKKNKLLYAFRDIDEGKSERGKGNEKFRSDISSRSQNTRAQSIKHFDRTHFVNQDFQKQDDKNSTISGLQNNRTLPMRNSQTNRTFSVASSKMTQINGVKNELIPRENNMIDHHGTLEKDRYFRKNIKDFPDYFMNNRKLMKSVTRPGTTSILKSLMSNFTRNQNGETNMDLSKFVSTITVLHENSVDYRKMNFLRLTILKEFQNIQYISIQHFAKFFSTILKIPNIESNPIFLSIRECISDDFTQNDYSEDIQLSMQKLNLLIDLYYHYPYLKRKDKNLSQDLYYILSSNKASKPLDIYNNNSNIASVDQQYLRSKSMGQGKQNFMNMTTQSSQIGSFNAQQVAPNPTLQDCLQILCDKIDERFKKVAAAFRFFDLRSSGKISFADFSFIIDQLQIRFNRQQVQDVFKFLDSDLDGYVTYNDFCELCEERRRLIDPFVNSVIQKARLRQAQSQDLNLKNEKVTTYQNDFNENQSSKDGSKKHENVISKQLQDYRNRKLQLKFKQIKNPIQEVMSTLENPSTRQSSSVSPMTKTASFYYQNENRANNLTPSEWSRRLKQSGAFGMASDFQRKQKCVADETGGEIKNILNYQYEKDFIGKAQELDKIYQSKKIKQKMNLIGHRSMSGYGGQGGETLASKKRNENIQRKLKIINQHSKNQEVQNPKINLTKQTYYPQHLINQYIIEKNGDFSIGSNANRSFYLQSKQQNNNLNKTSSLIEKPMLGQSNSFRENSLNSMRLINNNSTLMEKDKYNYALPENTQNNNQISRNIPGSSDQQMRVHTEYSNLRDKLKTITNGQGVGSGSNGGMKNLITIQRPQTTTSFHTNTTATANGNRSVHRHQSNQPKEEVRKSMAADSVKRLNLEFLNQNQISL